MAEQRKQELLEKLKPIIAKMVECSKILDSCVSNSRESGTFDVNSAVQGMSMVVAIQKELNTLVQLYSKDSGSGGTTTHFLLT